MARPSKLTPQQWVVVQRRWEGCDTDGFAWLSREIEAAWGVKVLRKSLEQAARGRAWEKGGEASRPLPPEARYIPLRGNVGGNIPQPVCEVADEVVDAPAPALPRKVGRPTAYRSEFADQIMVFFDKEPYTDVDVPQPNGLVKRQRMATDPPMLANFAGTIGVSKRTVDAWATAVDDAGRPRYPDFFEAYARARELQEALLTRGGALGLYDSRFVAFALKNLCGWQDQPTRAVEVAPISRDELEATYIKDIEEAHARQDVIDAERRVFLLGLDD